MDASAFRNMPDGKGIIKFLLFVLGLGALIGGGAVVFAVMKWLL